MDRPCDQQRFLSRTVRCLILAGLVSLLPVNGMAARGSITGLSFHTSTPFLLAFGTVGLLIIVVGVLIIWKLRSGGGTDEQTASQENNEADDSTDTDHGSSTTSEGAPTTHPNYSTDDTPSASGERDVLPGLEDDDRDDDQGMTREDLSDREWELIDEEFRKRYEDVADVVEHIDDSLEDTANQVRSISARVRKRELEEEERWRQQMQHLNRIADQIEHDQQKLDALEDAYDEIIPELQQQVRKLSLVIRQMKRDQEP
jgi:hypothetical protein